MMFGVVVVDITIVRFSIAEEAVEWYIDDREVDVVVVVIHSLAMTVEIVLHGGSVYAIGAIVVVGWSFV